MAHRKIQKGAHSQLICATALIANGWEVAEPLVTEAYDLVAKPPNSDEWKQIQVKTAKVRADRGNAVVVAGTKNNGSPYTENEVDYMAGVMENGDVYIFECRGLKEYWATPNTIAKWVKLTTRFEEIGQAKA